MISATAYRYLRMLLELAIFVVLTATVLGLLSLVQARAQQKPASPKPAPVVLPAVQAAEPLFREYRGVAVGMTADQVKQKLGASQETTERQDFYVFSSSESAQIFYDPKRVVIAVTVNYLNDSNAPTPEKVFGAPVGTAPDGSIYKMVKYERAGYFVAYTRTGGDAPPLVSVTMQKLNQ